MNRLLVAVPDEGMRDRIVDVEPSAEVIVWRAHVDPAPERTIDLLVLPYMVGPDYLLHLRGRPVRVVQSQMLGYDHVGEHLPAGMTYCNAVGVHEASTAELALALTLACQRGIDRFRDDQRDRRWDHQRTPGLAGARVLVVGAGGVGQRVASRLAAFDVELSMIARTARESAVGPIRSMADIWGELSRADVVIVTVPLSAQTRHLVDAKFLGAMRDGALLVNVARGAVVDTNALLREVSAGRLRAALDVVDPEPLPPDHPLWNAPGVLITPHVGGDTSAMTTAADRLVCDQIRRLTQAEEPANIVYAGAR